MKKCSYIGCISTAFPRRNLCYYHILWSEKEGLE
jgi:hypothetical protein